MKFSISAKSIRSEWISKSIALSILFFCSLSVSSQVKYVDINSGGGSGDTWGTAINSLTFAINTAAVGDELWIADGEYSITASLNIPSGIKLYGGFEGVGGLEETNITQRNIGSNRTIIRGEGVSGPLLNLDAVDGTTVIDGITITGANFSGAGGAIFINAGSPSIRNVRFVNNIANLGGAVAITGASDVEIFNSLFDSNEAAIANGAAIHVLSEDNNLVAIANCTFVNNNTSQSGVVVLEGSTGAPTVEVSNSIFFDNSAIGTTSVFVDHVGGAINLTNLLVQENTEENLTITGQGAGVIAPSGEIRYAEDPLFVEPASGLYSLQNGSPAENIGDIALFPTDNDDVNDNANVEEPYPFDLGNNSRVAGLIDLGAFETCLASIDVGLVNVSDDSGISDGEINLETAVTGGSGDYEYDWYIGVEVDLANFIQTTTFAGFSGLSAGQYTVVVRDISSACSTNPATFTVPFSPPPPPAPTNFVVYRSSPTELTLEWTDNAIDETAYEVLQSDTYDFLGSSLVTTLGPDAIDYTFTPLADKYYAVRPINGFEDFSSLSSVEFGTLTPFPGSSLQFDGVSDAIDLSSPILSGNSEFTIEAWLKLNAVPEQFDPIFNNPMTIGGITLNVSSTFSGGLDDLHVFMESGIGGDEAYTTSDFLQVGDWHHVAIVFDGSQTLSQDRVSIYVDGREEALTIGGGDGFPTSLEVADSNPSFAFENTQFSNIELDEVKYWDFAKTTFNDRFDLLDGNEPGLIAYYPMDDPAGEGVIVDRSINTSDGLFVGGPSIVTSTVPPPPQNALDFAGDDDFVDVARTALSAGLTFEAWVNTTSVDATIDYDGNPALSIIGDNDNGIRGAFGIHGGRVRYTHWTGVDLIFDIVESTVEVNDGLWHHVAVSHDSFTNEVRIYIDGVLDNVQTTSTYRTDFSFNRIGGSFLNGGSGDLFIGSLDEIRVWNGVLFEDEIRGFMYSNSLAGHPAFGNLAAHYTMDQGNAGSNNIGETTLVDQSVNALNGILNGFTLNGSTSNYVTSLAFDHSALIAPGAQASDVIVSNISANSADISWSNGDGFRRIVAIAQGSGNSFPVPTDLTFYNPDSFGLGDIIDGVWFVVYNGFSNSISVDGLLDDSGYEVAVLEMNGPADNEVYNASTSFDNPISFSTLSLPGFFEDFEDEDLNETNFSGSLNLTSGTWEVSQIDVNTNNIRLRAGVIGSFVQLPELETVQTFSFTFNSDGGDGISTDVFVSEDGGSTFNSIGTLTSLPTGVTPYSHDFGSPTTAIIRIETTAAAGQATILDDFISDGIPTISEINPNFALDFDGLNDHVVVPDADQLDLTTLGTIEMWINPRTLANDGISFRRMLAKPTATTSESSPYQVGILPDGSIQLILSDGSIQIATSNAGVVTESNWQHIAITWDGSNIRFYHEGVDVGQEAQAVIPTTNTAELIIGGFNGNTGAGQFDGQLDEIRIWNIARTQQDISNSMDFFFVDPLAAGLVANYAMADGIGPTVTDISSFSNNGTLTNMDEIVDWVEGPILNFNVTIPNTFYEDFDYELPATETTGTVFLSTGNWEIVGVLASGAADARDFSLNAAQIQPATGNYLQTPTLQEAITISFWYKGSTTGGSYQVLASDDGGSTFGLDLGTINPDPTYQEFTFDLSILSGQQSFNGPIRIVHVSGANPLFVEDFESDAILTPLDITLAPISIAGTTLAPGSTQNLIHGFSITPDSDVQTIGYILTLDELNATYVADDFPATPFTVWINPTTNDFGSATNLGSFDFGNELPEGGNVDPNQVALIFSELIPGGNTTYIYTTVDIAAGATPTNSFTIRSIDSGEEVGFVQENNLTGSAGGGGLFTIDDTILPSVLSITPSTEIIVSGETTFDLTIEFDEEMDQAVDPVITFPNEDVSNTLTSNGGAWANGTTYVASFNVTDVNEILDDVDVRIEDASDLASNVMNLFDALDVFSVDTQNPISALSAQNIQATSFTARWTVGQDVQAYQLDVSTVADFSSFVPGFENVSTTATNLDVTNLDFATNYFYRVRILDTSDQVSTNSNTQSVKTTIDIPTLADSAALVQIYEAMEGANWGVNWTTERLRNWDGVILDASKTRVSSLDINNRAVDASGNGFSLPNPFNEVIDPTEGPLNVSVNGLSALQQMNISGNDVSSLLDFSAIPIQTLDVSDNKLDFGDLEPLIGISTFTYANQANIQFDEETRSAFLRGSGTTDIIVPEGNNYVLSITTPGSDNTYTWSRNGSVIATGDDFTVLGNLNEIVNIGFDNMGAFTATVTSGVLPDLTLNVDPQNVLAVADIDMRIVDDNDEPLELTISAYLLDTVRVESGYDTLLDGRLEGIASEFTFNNVILGDYLCGIDPSDNDFIPTYYGDAFLWEEADVIQLRSDSTLTVVMEGSPNDLTPDDGEGSLAVLIEEDFGDDAGRIEARRAAKRRKCGLRRRTRSGRTGQDDDEFQLIAYGETDDNGQFQFGFLPAGTYQFFVEYPGIPIDDAASVQFEVGVAGIEDDDFSLSAFATEDGIEVTIETVLGVILDYFKDLEIYPNPSREYLNIRYRHLKSQDVTAQLIDLSGNLKWSQNLTNGFDGQLKVDVSDYTEGIYILRFYDRESPSENVVSYRVVVKD